MRSLIALPMKNKDDLVSFFTTGIANETHKPVARAGYKEGYLTKRGKNFGGWKTRYFVLQGPSLEYYESVSHPSFRPEVQAGSPAWTIPFVSSSLLMFIAMT